jgi:hypothetical protein
MSSDSFPSLLFPASRNFSYISSIDLYGPQIDMHVPSAFHDWL